MDNKQVVGGQAVIEGVMMRGPHSIATAVRKKDGSIVYKKQLINKKNNKYRNMVFLRGIFALYDAMVVGTKELIFASNQAGYEEEKLSDKEVTLTVLSSILIGISVFMILPAFVGGLLFPLNQIKANLVESIVKLILFLGYLYGISFIKDIKRVFEYHGAEHKTIVAYEEDKELIPKNAKECTRFHPRCGTSFLLIVMIISILFFSFIDLILGVPNNKILMLIYKLITRIVFVPVIAGISYEFQRWTSNHLDNSFVKMMAMPGMFLQKITTKEPDEEQLEVAIVALKVSLGEEVDNAKEVKDI